MACILKLLTKSRAAVFLSTVIMIFGLSACATPYQLRGSTEPDPRAFDNRERFFSSFGIGTSQASLRDQDKDKYSYQSLSTDLKIGTGVDRKVQVFWSTKFNWSFEENSEGEMFSSGIGAKYFFKETAPSFYLSGVYGFNRFLGEYKSRKKYDWNTDIFNDPGFSIALGYELASRWELELSRLTSIPSSDAERKHKIRSLQMNLIYAIF